MKYIVKSVSIFDSSVHEWEFEDLFEAQAKVRELKDVGSNHFMIKLYSKVSASI
jgi:hypothetical protein